MSIVGSVLLTALCVLEERVLAARGDVEDTVRLCVCRSACGFASCVSAVRCMDMRSWYVLLTS